MTLMSSCGLFLIFNVISGRLYLGDAGAYGLGAGVVLAGLFFNAQGIFSASFLGGSAGISLHRDRGKYGQAQDRRAVNVFA